MERSSALLSIFKDMFRKVIIILFCFLTPSIFFAQKVRILGFGSSFMEDAFYRVPELLKADTAKVELAFLYKAGCSLAEHIDLMRSQEPIYTYYKYNNEIGKWAKRDSTNSRFALLEHEWDIIVLQQSASESGLYSSVKNTLAPLIDSIYHYQPTVQLAWHMTWAFAHNSTHPAFNDYYNISQQLMYYQILSVGYKICRDEFVDDFRYLIPSGPVIQALRESYLECDNDFCRDGYHIDLNLGRYAIACATYESVLADVLNHDIRQVNVTLDKDTTHKVSDFAFIREIVYDICHNTDSLIWNYIKDDRVYNRRYYDLLGVPLPDLPKQRIVAEQEFYQSGRTTSHLIYKKE